MSVTTYARRLGLFDGTMVVIGGIIGAGIFLNPAIVAQRLSTTGWILAAWIAGGVIAVLGALCFAELGARRPQAGGGYVYLRDALGPLAAFLYGWTLLLVIGSGAIAAVAVTFARYAVDLLHLAPAAVNPLAICAILLLTGVNYVGVRSGSTTQNVFTVLKLLALAALIAVSAAAAFGLVGGGAPRVSQAPAAAAPGGIAMIGAFGAALIPILFSYGGWQQANMIAEEIVEPRRNLPRALLLGVAAVVAAYVLANVAYLATLGPWRLSRSLAPASDTMRAVLGPWGGTLIAAGIVASTFGFLNLVILVSPRVYQAMADDGLFFGWAARLHPRFRTPSGALLFQAAWSIVLLLSGTYGQLLDYVVFGDWIFFGLVVSTMFVYRRREARAGAGEAGAGVPPAAGYRAWGYPVTPALFVLAALYVVGSSVASNPHNAAVGALLLAVGVPVFLFWRARGARLE